MTDETRKDQEHKDELADKDLEQASGGHAIAPGDKRAEDRAEEGRAEDHRDSLRMGT
jgi:hypothetical protein